MGFFGDTSPDAAWLQSTFGAGTRLRWIGTTVDVASVVRQAGTNPAAILVRFGDPALILTGAQIRYGIALRNPANPSEPGNVLVHESSEYAGDTVVFGDDGTGIADPSPDPDLTELVIAFEDAEDFANVSGIAPTNAATEVQKAKDAGRDPLDKIKDIFKGIDQLAKDALKSEEIGFLIVGLLVLLFLYETEVKPLRSK